MDPGKCPKALPLAEFDAVKYSGDWYMISFKPNMMESATLTCRQDTPTMTYGVMIFMKERKLFVAA